MQSSDFSIGKSHFKGKTSVWGNTNVDIWIHFDCDRHEGEKSEFLTSILGLINKRLEWIENNRLLLKTALVESKMLEETEEWIEKAKDAEETQKGVYALKDGQKVSLPLDMETFLAGLSVSGLVMTFDPDEQKPETELFIHCKPDYFMDNACLQVEINYDDTIEECIILSESSPDKPWE